MFKKTKKQKNKVGEPSSGGTHLLKKRKKKKKKVWVRPSDLGLGASPHPLFQNLTLWPGFALIPLCSLSGLHLNIHVPTHIHTLPECWDYRHGHLELKTGIWREEHCPHCQSHSYRCCKVSYPTTSTDTTEEPTVLHMWVS